jgi:hypothetical protein
MIGAMVKSHFSLIGKRSLVWNPNLMLTVHAAVQYICNISGSRPAPPQIVAAPI